MPMLNDSCVERGWQRVYSVARFGFGTLLLPEMTNVRNTTKLDFNAITTYYETKSTAPVCVHDKLKNYLTD